VGKYAPILQQFIFIKYLENSKYYVDNMNGTSYDWRLHWPGEGPEVLRKIAFGLHGETASQRGLAVATVHAGLLLRNGSIAKLTYDQAFAVRRETLLRQKETILRYGLGRPSIEVMTEHVSARDTSRSYGSKTSLLLLLEG
jgi:hypothetical protein